MTTKTAKQTAPTRECDQRCSFCNRSVGKGGLWMVDYWVVCRDCYRRATESGPPRALPAILFAASCLAFCLGFWVVLYITAQALLR